MLVVKLLHFEFDVALGLTLLSVTWERMSFLKEWHGKWYSKTGAENKEWGGNSCNKTGAEYNLTKISFLSQKTRMKSWFGQTKYMFSSKILAWEYFLYFKIRTTQIVVCNIIFFPFEKLKWSSISSSFIQAMFHCKSLKKSENSGQWLYMTSKSTLCLFFSVYLLELSRVFFCLFF